MQEYWTRSHNIEFLNYKSAHPPPPPTLQNYGLKVIKARIWFCFDMWPHIPNNLSTLSFAGVFFFFWDTVCIRKAVKNIQRRWVSQLALKFWECNKNLPEKYQHSGRHLLQNDNICLFCTIFCTVFVNFFMRRVLWPHLKIPEFLFPL